MLFLLDTNAITAAMNEEPGISRRVKVLPASDALATCAIVRGETLFGIERLPDGSRRRDLAAKANKVFSGLQCHAVPPEAGDHYARVKQVRRVQGLTMDENDLWIAATALALGATLVTRDGDFNKIDGLNVEDWMA